MSIPVWANRHFRVSLKKPSLGNMNPVTVGAANNAWSFQNPGIAGWAGAGISLAQGIGTSIQNSKINDVSGYEDLYNEFSGQRYYGDIDSVINQRRDAFLPEAPTWKEIRGMSGEQQGWSIANSALSGAAAGASFGGIGAVIGAGIGSLLSGIGVAVGNRKAKNEAEELSNKQASAVAQNDTNYRSALDSANRENNFRAMQHVSAFGGPLDFMGYPISGAIDYDIAQRRLAQKDLELGKVKALGGPLHSYGTDWSNGVTLVDSGGTHESNPFEGVPMGIAPDGKPNLVEEGEVIFDDYVFSNRLKVPEAVRNKYKLRGTKGMTFADAAKKAQKESEERPNDPISQRGLEDIMSKLMVEQEAMREKGQQRKFASGGTIHIAPSKKGTFTAAASKHNMGVQEFASKVLANPEDYSPAMRKKANFARNASKWKHDLGGYLIDNNLFAKGGQVEPFPILGDPNYEYGKYVYKFGDEPRVVTPESLVSMEETPGPLRYFEKPKKSWFDPAWLRYAPVVTGAVGLFQSLKKPDYSNAKRIERAARSIRRVEAPTIGNYVKKRQFNTLFYANQLAAQAAATRRAILNNSNGNRMTAIAGLLGADINAQNALGNLYRKGEEFNAEWDLRGEGFNRETNLANAENSLKAQMTNGELDTKTVQFLTEAARIREQEDAARMAAISANLTNLGDNLGNIGREEVFKRWVNDNPYFLYSIGNGGIGYRGAKGGYLTIKKRRK